MQRRQHVNKQMNRSRCRYSHAADLLLICYSSTLLEWHTLTNYNERLILDFKWAWAALMHWPYITYVFRNVSFDIWCIIFSRIGTLRRFTPLLWHSVVTCTPILKSLLASNRQNRYPVFYWGTEVAQVHSGRPTPQSISFYTSTTSHRAECRQSLPFQMSVDGAQRASHDSTVNNSRQASVALLVIPYTSRPQVLSSTTPRAAATSSIHN